MALQTGQIFGNYRVVRLLGEGGFGEVYLAENPLIERRAAVKVLHTALAQDEELVRRFLNEARAASAIRHPQHHRSLRCWRDARGGALYPHGVSRRGVPAEAPGGHRPARLAASHRDRTPGRLRPGCCSRLRDRAPRSEAGEPVLWCQTRARPVANG